MQRPGCIPQNTRVLVSSSFSEEPTTSIGRDHGHSRVCQLPFGSYRLELLLTFFSASNNAETLADFFRDNRWHRHEPQTVECENIHEGRVVKFSDEARTNTHSMKPFLKRTAQSAIRHWQPRGELQAEADFGSGRIAGYRRRAACKRPDRLGAGRAGSRRK